MSTRPEAYSLISHESKRLKLKTGRAGLRSDGQIYFAGRSSCLPVKGPCVMAGTRAAEACEEGAHSSSLSNIQDRREQMDSLNFGHSVASTFPLKPGFVEMLNNLPLTRHFLGRRAGLQMV